MRTVTSKHNPCTQPAHPLLGQNRRQVLAMLAGLSAWTVLPRSAWASTGAGGPAGISLAAAWEREGSFYIGSLSAHEGAGQALQVRAAMEVPTRAHGLCVLPGGAVLAVSRRPGDWMVHWQPGRGDRPPLWLWQDGERSFNGHALCSPDGQRVYTTETDTETGQSLIGVRHAATLQKIAEWPTHGIDAHELIWDTGSRGAPTLIVANGGVPTSPETGRVKRDLDTMDSSLVRLDGRRGDLLGQWRLEDKRLSLRHLAWSPDGKTLGIALQAEHGDSAAKAAAPILARFDGQQLTPHAAPRSLSGYGGSIAATRAGWAVSCPRVDGVAHFTADGTWRGLIPLEEVCALAADAQDQLWAAGLTRTLQDAQGDRPVAHPHAPALAGARMDNHWVRL
ncbi:twin-arginine translocation pathway signal protein [Acidovorax sp. Leaf76]|nr:twin-arginine translocation pathway signal protein [Acidovorax sp. Leaf76]KQO35289.1 twin-arginine translocation pathway signal protein [Acidovorax sp. Leaf84]KQS35071.1 twin-arginine translocation pathway signal protein [Acidovorax sp. Leaf191]